MKSDNKEPKLTFDEYIQRGNKRMAIVSSLWVIIGAPFVFLTNPNYMAEVMIFIFMPYCLVGVRLAPYLIHKIWKD